MRHTRAVRLTLIIVSALSLAAFTAACGSSVTVESVTQSTAAIPDLLPTYTSITAKAAAVMPLTSYPDTLTTAPLQRIATLMRAGGLATPSNVASLLFQ